MITEDPNILLALYGAIARTLLPWYVYVIAIVVAIPLWLLAQRLRQGSSARGWVSSGPQTNIPLQTRVAAGAVALLTGAVVLAVMGRASILPWYILGALVGLLVAEAFVYLFKRVGSRGPGEA